MSRQIFFKYCLCDGKLLYCSDYNDKEDYTIFPVSRITKIETRINSNDEREMTIYFNDDTYFSFTDYNEVYLDLQKAFEK